MTTVKQSVSFSCEGNLWERTFKSACLILIIALSAAMFLAREELDSLALYGYPAIFLLSLFGSASLILPAPTFAFVLVAGSTLNPVAVGLAAGLGAALGELTGYYAGRQGIKVLEKRFLYRRMGRWLERYGAFVIFVLAAVPSGLFDIGGILAGSTRMPLSHFLLAGWLGKTLRLTILAFTGGLLFQ